MYSRLARGPLKSAKSAGEISLDVYFQELELWRKMVPKDTFCLYRIASEILLGTQVLHELIQTLYRQYRATLHINVDDLMSLMQYLSVLTKTDFYIFWSSSKQMKAFTSNNFENKTILCTVDDRHFDLVYPLGLVSSSALCQSLLYELLYDQVFDIEDSVLKGREMMRKEDFITMPYSPYSTYLSSHLLHPHPSQLTFFDTPHPHRAAFPYKVAKSLSLEILRNVEYDAWLDSKKNKDSSSDPFAAMPGDKCQVTLREHGEVTFNAHIQEVKGEEGMVVFVEGLGEKHVVTKDALTMLSKNLHPDCKRRNKKSMDSLDVMNQEAVKKRYNRFNSVCPTTHLHPFHQSIGDDEEGLVGAEYSRIYEANESVFYEMPMEARMGAEGVVRGGDVSLEMKPCTKIMQASTGSPTTPACTSNHFMVVPAPDAHLLNHHDHYPTPVDLQATFSTDPLAQDLPEASTCRFFYNLGVMTYKGLTMLHNQNFPSSPHTPYSFSDAAYPPSHFTYPPSHQLHNEAFLPSSPSTPAHQVFMPPSDYILITNPSDSKGTYMGQGAYGGSGMGYFISTPPPPITPPFMGGTSVGYHV